MLVPRGTRFSRVTMEYVRNPFSRHTKSNVGTECGSFCKGHRGATLRDFFETYVNPRRYCLMLVL